jgi:hypothetical protein
LGSEVCDKLDEFHQFAEKIDGKHDGLLNDKKVDHRVLFN